GLPPLFLARFIGHVRGVPKLDTVGLLPGHPWMSHNNLPICPVVGPAICPALAYATGRLHALHRPLTPYPWALYSPPRIILVPLVFLWFGITNDARLVIIIISVVPSFVVVVMEGVKTTDPSLLRAARSFGASRWQLFRQVIIPSTVPFIGTGVRMGM